MKKFCLMAIAAVFMSGCIPIRTTGTTHYLVIGIGVVSVNNTNQAVAQVTKETILGGYVTDSGVGIGYKSSNRIMVNTNSDIDVEASSVPFNPLKVNAK